MKFTKAIFSVSGFLILVMSSGSTAFALEEGLNLNTLGGSQIGTGDQSGRLPTRKRTSNGSVGSGGVGSNGVGTGDPSGNPQRIETGAGSNGSGGVGTNGVGTGDNQSYLIFPEASKMAFNSQECEPGIIDIGLYCLGSYLQCMGIYSSAELCELIEAECQQDHLDTKGC